MSWVPSPSPRLTASYREVSVPTVLGATAISPLHGHGSPVGGHVPTPSGLSFGMPAAMPPTAVPAPVFPQVPQQRQGSFTPAPSHHANTAGPRGLSPSLAQLNFPARLGSMNNMPYTQPALPPSRERNLQQRSWTPLPMPSVLAGLERPSSILDDKLSHSLTMLPMDLNVPDLTGSPAASPIADLRVPSGLSGMSSGISNGLSNGSPVSSMASAIPANAAEAEPERRQFTHRPKQRSFSQAPVPVILNVYWQRPVTFDEQGRAQRKLGGDDLSWRQRFVKDVLGVYHVGIEVHGTEYTFGNYHAPGSRQVGTRTSGIIAHEPRRPGPHCVFKQAETLGATTVAAGQVEDICNAFGSTDWTKQSYNKIHHNCVDFSRTLAAKLGAGEPPAWCSRGAAVGKILGIGGPEPEENSLDSGNANDSLAGSQGPRAGGSLAGPVGATASAQQSRPHGADALTGAQIAAESRQQAMDLATAGNSGTYVAPPPLPQGPLPGGSLAGTYVAPPMSGTYVAPPGPPPTGQPSLVPAPAAEALTAGSRVSVLQSNGSWSTGKIVCQDYDNRFTILYDSNWSTEVNVPNSRIVLLPEANDGPALSTVGRGWDLSRMDALFPASQASYFDDLVNKPPPAFQGLASADSILEPLKMQGKSLGGISGGLARPSLSGLNPRLPTVPSFAAPAAALPQFAPAGSFTMGGFSPQRASPALPPAAIAPVRNTRPHAAIPTAVPSGGYIGAMAPIAVSQAPRVRNRDTLSGTWRW